MKLSITDAAKAVNVSRSTLSRDVSKGRVSASRDGKGKPYIELVELERVYGNVNIDAPSEPVSMTHHDTTYVDALLQSKEAEITLLKQQLDAVTQRLDVSESERRRATEQVTALLTDQRARAEAHAEIETVKAELEAERERGFWSRLLRR
jgi:uncharacterized membrane protein YqiK